MANRSMNRLSCDSGSGNVPAESRGFCVATTRKGSGRGRVSPSSDTWRSLMASSTTVDGLGPPPLVRAFGFSLTGLVALAAMFSLANVHFLEFL